MNIFGAQPTTPTRVQKTLNETAPTVKPQRATLAVNHRNSKYLPVANRSIVRNAVSLGGSVIHAAAPPMEAETNLIGSLPAPVNRTLGGGKRK